jgi:flagellin-specific chaperone FliS/sorbitol-specific phosphotransferase system component IIA
MFVSKTHIRSFRLISVLSLPLMAAFSLLPPAVAEETIPSESSEDSTQATGQSPDFTPNSEDVINPENLRPLAQETSLLSLQAGNRLMAEAQNAIAAEDYAQAGEKLQQARQIFNQLSNFHQQLSASFGGVDNQISEFHRYQAVETAQKRDEATYQLALVHSNENNPELSVPLLIQVIQSQGITRELGQQADQLLTELGFGQMPEGEASEAEAETVPPLARDGSVLGIEAGQRLLAQAKEAIGQNDYATAAEELQQARGMLNQLSNFYEQLAASFAGIDPERSEFQRNQAVATAQMRDEATYQLALVHRADNKAELAIPLLIQIIRSQQPTRDLGQQAYQQLYELGFVSSPYSSNASNNSPNFSSDF